MNDQNPWQHLPHDIYEKHMGHENVRQLEMLSCIVSEQLALVSELHKPVVAFLGITGGNGLRNIIKGKYETVIGMDINEKYLDVCRKRHNDLPELVLYQIDLMTEKDRAVNLLQNADLVTANLLVMYIYLSNFIYIVSKLKKAIVSVVIQFNPDGEAISQSGFENEFEEIVRHGQNCDENSLTSAMLGEGYMLIGREEYILPNRKMFIRLDYKR